MPVRPSDETPVIGLEDGRGGTQEAQPARVEGATAPAVEEAISELGHSIAGSYDAAAAAIGHTVAGLRDSLADSALRASRAVTRVTNAADKAIGDNRNTLSRLGVPVPFGTGETAAQLADPTGRAMIDAVKAASEYSPELPAVGPTAVRYCYWTWNGSAWVGASDDGGPPPPPDSQPKSPGAYPGEIRVAECSPAAPAPEPEPSPAPPTDTPEPSGDCPSYTVGYDGNDPDLFGAKYPARDLQSPPLSWYWVVWSPLDNPGITYAINLPHAPATLPAGGVVRQQLEPEEGWSVLPAVDPCGSLPPSPPPIPPPPPPTGPQQSCPPPTIVVNCAPACEPTSPPPPPYPPGEPSPPTSPPPPPPPGEPEPPTSPPPPTAPIGITRPDNVASVFNWDDPTTCSLLNKVAGIPAPGASSATVPEYWRLWGDQGKGAEPRGPLAIPGLDPGAARTLDAARRDGSPLAEVVTDQVVGGSIAALIAAQSANSRHPQWAEALVLGGTLALASVAESKSGLPMTYLTQSDRYALQYYVPVYLPGQADIDNLYLTNKINDDYWECLTRSHGNLPVTHRLARDAKAVRPILSEVVQLRLRDVLKTDAAFVERARELGVTRPSDAMEFLKLSQWIPGPSDLITFMVRDAADDQVAAKYKYDDGFDQKFAGPIKQWAAAQGVTEDVFRYNWRSHWKIPSNTQLYSMLHRLRPDRPEVVEWERAQLDAAQNGLPFDPATRPRVVTREEVAEALRINDTAPGWVQPLIDVSYHPLTNTDARRAFEIGFFDRDQLKAVMLDNGYNDTDAETLTRYFAAERNKRIGATTGVMSPRVILTGYRNGELTRLQAFELLEESFPDPDVRSRQLDRSDIQVRMEVRRSQIAAIKKGYVFGEYDDAAARFRLQQHGVPIEVHDQLIARFRAAREGHKKEPRVTLLCQWYTHRLITREQYFERLMRLGYTSADASRISQVCENDAIAKAAREREQAAQRLRAEARSNLAELRKQIAEAKESIKDYEKRLKELKAAAGETAPE